LSSALTFATDTTSNSSSKAFDQSVNFGKVSFQIQCPNDSSLNKVVITPKGISNKKVVTAEADGTITGVQIADIDNNGFPEIYISVTSAGSGSYGSLLAYASNKNKSISPIYLPELTKKQLKGYMGHDEFKLEKNVIIRLFPIYKDGDTNAKPTGKTRQIQYSLKPGEAGWKLVVTKTLES
jgi:hypothetical protein